MEEVALLQLPDGMHIEQIQITENGLVIEVVATPPTPCCPLCSEPSSSIHCQYRWTLRDASCAGRRVQLCLCVCTFSCCNSYCERKVLKRWQEGERRGVTLQRELMEQDYTGSDRTLYRYLAALQQAEVKASVRLHHLQKFSASTAIWLFVRHLQKLDEVEQEDLAAYCQASTTLKKAYGLIHDVLKMVHHREGDRFDAWLTQIVESGLPELQSFAAGIEKNKDAMRAGLTGSINNGMVEGHVTKLKRIKRQGYGRTGFPLLRKRVLHSF